MTWRCAAGPYLWLPMSTKAHSPGEPHGPTNVAQPAFSTHLRPETRTQMRTACPLGFLIAAMWQHLHTTEMHAGISSVISRRNWFSCATATVYPLLLRREEVKRHVWKATSEELTSCQATAHTAPFINASDVEEDVKSGERVRKRFGERLWINFLCSYSRIHAHITLH